MDGNCRFQIVPKNKLCRCSWVRKCIGHVFLDIKNILFSLCVRCLHRDGLEDPLDDAGLVQQQLDQLSTIGRCEYEKTCALLVQLFDQAAQTYQELLQSTNSSAADITVQEGMSCTQMGIQAQALNWKFDIWLYLQNVSDYYALSSGSFLLLSMSSRFLGCKCLINVIFSPCRSVDMVGLYNRGRDRWTGVVCEYRWAGRHGRRVSLSVRIYESRQVKNLENVTFWGTNKRKTYFNLCCSLFN